LAWHSFVARTCFRSGVPVHGLAWHSFVAWIGLALLRCPYLLSLRRTCFTTRFTTRFTTCLLPRHPSVSDRPCLGAGCAAEAGVRRLLNALAAVGRLTGSWTSPLFASNAFVPRADNDFSPSGPLQPQPSPLAGWWPASHRWFHGRITRVLAEARLEEQDVGTFLFRESESRPGYSLSLRSASLPPARPCAYHSAVALRFAFAAAGLAGEGRVHNWVVSQQRLWGMMMMCVWGESPVEALVMYLYRIAAVPTHVACTKFYIVTYLPICEWIDTYDIMAISVIMTTWIVLQYAHVPG